MKPAALAPSAMRDPAADKPSALVETMPKARTLRRGSLAAALRRANDGPCLDFTNDTSA